MKSFWSVIMENFKNYLKKRSPQLQSDKFLNYKTQYSDQKYSRYRCLRNKTNNCFNCYRNS